VIIAQNLRQVAETPVDSYYNSYYGVTYTKGVNIPSYATNTDGFTFVMAASEFAANNSEAPTLQDNDYGVYGQVVAPTAISSGRTSVGLYGIQQAKGSTNEFIMTWGTPSGQAAQSITLAGGAWPTTPVTPAPVTGAAVELVRNGGIVPAEALYYDGTSLKGTDRILILPQRVITAAKWVARAYGPSYMIHRGGSADYVEHTRQAVTRSVFLGATNIEMSVWFSKDDVAFCCHDPNLSVLTNGTDTRNIADLTAAELDQITITKSGAGSGEKLMRLSWVIEKYGSYVVITVEDKSYNHMTQLITLFESYFGSKANERFMIKANGAGGTGHMTLPNSKGYLSWSYWYNTDGNRFNDPGQASKFALYTTFGMPWDSSDAIYQAALGMGKPLIVHIVPSASAAAYAKEHGGANVGMQIASPLSVIPRINEPLT
jgi:glycerophosphoryl diester phosphodiesterase